MTTPDPTAWRRAFNSPLEAGVRALAVLFETYPLKVDINRLVHFDYLVVHSADVPDGPPSLHPATPLRSGELLVRRALIEQGVQIFLSRSLIESSHGNRGIVFGAAELAAGFLTSLESSYSQRLRERAAWAVRTFSDLSDSELETFIRQNLDRWGSEFETPYAHREVPEWQ